LIEIYSAKNEIRASEVVFAELCFDEEVITAVSILMNYLISKIKGFSTSHVLKA